MNAKDTAKEIVRRATVDGWDDFEKGGAESPYLYVEGQALIDAIAAELEKAETESK